MKNLDTVYEALKKAPMVEQETPLGVGPAQEIANHVVKACRAATDSDEDFKRLYDEVSPQALVIITTSLAVIDTMAAGELPNDLDDFLRGLTYGKADA